MARLAKMLTFLLLFAVIYMTCTGRVMRDTLTPVVLIPGHGGNQMEMHVSRQEPIAPGCPTETNDWVRSWLNIWDFLPGSLDCWISHNILVYDVDHSTYSDVAGVRHRIPGWGQVESIEYLDPSYSAYVLGNIGSYFAPLIHELESWGYKRGLNIRGAPYDFRYSPLDVPNLFEPLKELVEEMYLENGNSKVALLSHSMGGLISYYFLEKQSPEWKRKYIHSMVTMNTPWHGVVSMAEAVLSGYTWGFDGMNPNKFRSMQNTCPSGVFMMPSPAEWNTGEVVVQTADKNYTSVEYEQMLEDMGYHIGRLMWKNVKKDLLDIDNPGVDTWCFYSSGIPTPEKLVYEKGTFPDGPPKRVMGDGDGTSNYRSASACKRWQDTFDHLVTTREFKDTTHNGIMSSKELFYELQGVLLD